MRRRLESVLICDSLQRLHASASFEPRLTLEHPRGDTLGDVRTAQELELLLALAPQRFVDAARARINSPLDGRVGERWPRFDLTRDRQRALAQALRFDELRDDAKLEQLFGCNFLGEQDHLHRAR